MQFPCAFKYENQEKLKIIKNIVFYKYDKEGMKEDKEKCKTLIFMYSVLLHFS